MKKYSRLINIIVAGAHLGLSPITTINSLSKDSISRKRMKREIDVSNHELDSLLKKAGFDLFFMRVSPNSASRHYISIAKKIFEKTLRGAHNGQ
jgi:hypothetical protein